MRNVRFILAVLVGTMAAARPALAVEGKEVKLLSTTVAGHPVDVIGQFDITAPDRMVYRVTGSPDLNIPYAKIVEFSTRVQVKHHLGVAPAIAVGLVKRRQKDHFLTVSFRDADDTMQVATFEVSKREPEILVSLLQAKARGACERREQGFCAPVVPPPVQPRRLP